MLAYVLYLLVGAVSGFLSGLLGIGGGLVIVPCLMLIFAKFDVVASGQLMHLVLGTSLASTVINLCASVREHQKHRAIKWPVFFSMLPGLIIGSLLLGPFLMLVTSSTHLQIIFGVFCIVLSLYMLKGNKKIEAKERLPNRYILSALGLVAGSISTVLGIAGGVLVGAILNYFKMDARKMVGTTAASGLAIALPASIALMAVAFHAKGLPSWSTGYVYWPAFLAIAVPSFFIAPIGARLAHKLPASTLRNLFAVLVFAVGLQMLIK